MKRGVEINSEEGSEVGELNEDTFNQRSNAAKSARGTRSMKSEYESGMYFSALEDGDDLFREIEQDERKDAIMEMAKKFKPHVDLKDDYRLPGAHKDGGFPLDDPEVLARYRNAFKHIASQIGRSIFTGRFNLGSVSFPIKCMSPQSILPVIATMSVHSPVYLTAAALTDDPVERMKFVVTNALSYYYPSHIFDKPLNPILGETYQGCLSDGSQVFME